MNKLGPDDIRTLHDVMLERYGGIPGDKEPGLIDYMAEKPFMEIFGQEQYPGIFMKAAAYMEGLATHQYFHDGNKRTAYMCGAAFLELNGYQLHLSDDELYEMMLKIANYRENTGQLMPIKDIASLLKEHTK